MTIAYPIKTYADIYDQTYGRIDGKSRDHFGHLMIRDSNTAGKDYLLVGLNTREDSSMDVGIRLHHKQVKQIIRALNKWLERIEDTPKKVLTGELRSPRPNSSQEKSK